MCQVVSELFHAEISSNGHVDRNNETNWCFSQNIITDILTANRTDQFTIPSFVDNTILQSYIYLY